MHANTATTKTNEVKLTARIEAGVKLGLAKTGAALGGAFVVVIAISAVALTLASTGGKPADAKVEQQQSIERGIGPGLGEVTDNPLESIVPAAIPGGTEMFRALSSYADEAQQHDSVCSFAFELDGEEPYVPAAVQPAASEGGNAAPSPTANPVETRKPASLEFSVQHVAEVEGLAACVAVEPAACANELKLLEDTSADLRARYEAWNAIEAGLSAADRDTQLRLARLMGRTGNLPLEWKIAHKLSNLTGADCGRDGAAWIARLSN